MKKLIVCGLTICFLLMLTAMYTYAKPEEHLVNWYNHYFHHMDKVEAIFAEENEHLQKTITRQKESAIKDSKEEIVAFYEKTATHSKMDVENYQQAYLSRLTETKHILGESNFKAFSKKKKEEVSFEISQDVKEYLTGLLDE